MSGVSKRGFLQAAAGVALNACASEPVRVPPFAPVTGPTAVARHGALKVQGNKILDASGQPAVLRGMSLFWSQWMPQFYNAECVRWLRDDWGVNVVRAAIAAHHGGYDSNPERESAKAYAVIDAAIASGIYVVVDWHSHRPDAENAIRFFSDIAQRYAGQPNIIYEPYNEPEDEHDWPNIVKPYHERVIAAIRAHDPSNLIVAGNPNWSQDVDVAAADPLNDPNVAYTLHYYASSHKQPLRDKAQRALDLGAALFVTEYGVTEYTGNGFIDVAEVEAWWRFLEERQISYLNWSICDKAESSAAVKPGASGTGGWADRALTQSGLMVRAQIRARKLA